MSSRGSRDSRGSGYRKSLVFVTEVRVVNIEAAGSINDRRKCEQDCWPKECGLVFDEAKTHDGWTLGKKGTRDRFESLGTYENSNEELDANKFFCSGNDCPATGKLHLST